jgi:ribosomal protein L2
MLYVLKSDFKFKSEFLVKNSFFKRIKKYLLIGSSNKSGHNMYGRITVFTKGGRIFKKIRKIDFKRIIFSKGIIVSKERN